MKHVSIRQIRSFQHTESPMTMPGQSKGKLDWTALEVLRCDVIPIHIRLRLVLREEFLDEDLLYEFTCLCAEHALPMADFFDKSKLRELAHSIEWEHDGIDIQDIPYSMWDYPKNDTDIRRFIRNQTPAGIAAMLASEIDAMFPGLPRIESNTKESFWYAPGLIHDKEDTAGKGAESLANHTNMRAFRTPEDMIWMIENRVFYKQEALLWQLDTLIRLVEKKERREDLLQDEFPAVDDDFFYVDPYYEDNADKKQETQDIRFLFFRDIVKILNGGIPGQDCFLVPLHLEHFDTLVLKLFACRCADRVLDSLEEKTDYYKQAIDYNREWLRGEKTDSWKAIKNYMASRNWYIQSLYPSRDRVWLSGCRVAFLAMRDDVISLAKSLQEAALHPGMRDWMRTEYPNFLHTLHKEDKKTVQAMLNVLAGSTRKMQRIALKVLRSESVSLSDRMQFALQQDVVEAKILHRFACYCAEHALRMAREKDPRSWNGIRTKRAWLNGKTTSAELEKTRREAYEAIEHILYDGAEARTSRLAAFFATFTFNSFAGPISAAMAAGGTITITHEQYANRNLTPDFGANKERDRWMEESLKWQVKKLTEMLEAKESSIYRRDIKKEGEPLKYQTAIDILACRTVPAEIRLRVVLNEDFIDLEILMLFASRCVERSMDIAGNKYGRYRETVEFTREYLLGKPSSDGNDNGFHRSYVFGRLLQRGLIYAENIPGYRAALFLSRADWDRLRKAVFTSSENSTDEVEWQVDELLRLLEDMSIHARIPSKGE